MTLATAGDGGKKSEGDLEDLAADFLGSAPSVCNEQGVRRLQNQDVEGEATHGSGGAARTVEESTGTRLRPRSKDTTQLPRTCAGAYRKLRTRLLDESVPLRVRQKRRVDWLANFNAALAKRQLRRMDNIRCCSPATLNLLAIPAVLVVSFFFYFLLHPLLPLPPLLS